MRIATVPSKRRKDLIIIAILLIGLPILVFASYQVYQLIAKASVEATPQNVVLSNLTTSSVTVSWTTETNASGSVTPVLNGVEQSPVLDKRGSGKRYTHYVELTNLEPSTQYEFIIISDSKKYSKESEKTFTFKTAHITADTPTPNPIHGSVSGSSGDDVILFAMLKDKSTYPISAVMPRGGNWIMDMSALRNLSDNSLTKVSDSTNIVLISVSGLNKGAVVEGTYLELFDSNGKLKDVYTLSISDNSNLYSYFPPASMLQAYSSEEIVPVKPIVKPVEEQIVEEEEDFERKYELIHDLNWIDMVTSSGGATGKVGESTIQVTNLTDTGFTVIWISGEKEEGYVKYGTSSTALGLEVNDERDVPPSKNAYYTHIASANRLQPETEYFFEIHSGDQVYDSSGSKYRVTTLPTLSSPPPYDSIRGEIDGMPEHNEVIVVAQIKDQDDAGSKGISSKVANAVDENGRWILSIADSRTEDGSSYFEYTSGDVLNIDFVTTFQTSSHTEKMQDISSKEIQISLENIGSTTYTRVELLGSYGVLGYNTGANVSTEEGESTVTPESIGVGETPKTGVFDSPFLLSVTLITLVVVISLLYISSVTKKSKKGKMKNNI